MNPYAMCNLYNNSYPCGCTKSNNNQLRNNYEPANNFSYEWSRLGPMGGLVEPKLIYVPPDPSADIEIETNIRTKISQQPKLGIVNHMRSEFSPLPPPDLLRRINEERLRTTYQSDFCNLDNYPLISDYSNWIYNSNNKARLSNMQRKESEEMIECRPQPKPPYLGGHQIPGRAPRDFSFGVREKKANARKRTSQTSGRPSRGSKDFYKDEVDKSQLDNPRKSFAENEVEVNSKFYENTAASSPRHSSNGLDDEFSYDSGKKNSFDNYDNNNGSNNSNYDNNKNNNNSIDGSGSKIKNLNNDTYVNLNYSNRKRRYTIDLGSENFDINLLPLPWTSEYQDTISGTADEILRTKLHYYGRLRLLPEHIAYKKKQADKKTKDKKKQK
ncbi:myb-like protein H [Microplitis mediator]|uniref:myb-like protein H n=1 Tax=Microplitis mediator TaxID=375433 RepID=UPI0025528954|nr:myb-like protein H [Microplitis mediator]XP_057319249.1 myb-like protein H [Microplitis mediator]XP_057319250.1 myb-like protein H [Microplitis mediator]XP_057319251.1 myb-like protein H [Microplitis mediator]